MTAEPVTVIVVGVTPVPGSDIDLDKFAGSVERVQRREIERAHDATFPDALGKHSAGVTLSDAQGSTLQPDLNYRGFTASPVLGLPQGLAVYQGGTRINDAFGDAVEWDLLPTFAVQQADLLTGVNAVYGLNALGGALVLRMKDGFSYQGVHALASSGSFGRSTLQFESGISRGIWAVYAGGDIFHERGFRAYSPSSARRLYAEVRRKDRADEFAVTLSAGNTRLTGNGPAPVELLERDRSAVFTHPDTTRNAQTLLGVEKRLSLSDVASLRFATSARRSVRNTLNGDEAEFSPCSEPPTLLCNDDGRRLTNEAGRDVPSTLPASAVNNTTRTATSGLGLDAQLALLEPLHTLPNHLTLGTSVDGSLTDFSQRSELGALTSDRGVSGSGVHLAGAGRHTLLSIVNTSASAFATDTLSFAPWLHVTAAARWNWLHTKLEDELSDTLSAEHTFARVNPAIGVSLVVRPGINVYTNYSEASRAPSAVELSCADPNQPCRVPNAFLSDPHLSQVVTRLVELGLRFRHAPSDTSSLDGSVVLFGSRNYDDILFVAGSRIGTGYFRNAGITQRVGAEASATFRGERFNLYALYQLLRPTFESNLTLPGTNHPLAGIDSNGQRTIQVRPGDVIPSIPIHTLKLGGGIEPFQHLSVGASLNVSSGQYLRGDEANLLPSLSGYAVVDAQLAYRFAPIASVFLDGQNLLATRYETFGILGNPRNVLPFASDPRFLTPSPPRGVWAGIELRFAP